MKKLLLISLYLTLALTWAYRLRPQAEPKADTTQLEAQQKIAAFMGKGAKDSAIPFVMRLIKLTDAQILSLAEWVAQPSSTQVRQLTVQQTSLEELGPHWGAVLLLAALGNDPLLPPLETHLMVSAAGDRLTTEGKIQLLHLLAQRAQAQGDAKEAVIILGRASELPGAEWNTLQTLAATARANRDVTPALKALTAWIDRHPSEDSTPDLEAARDLETALFIQSDRAIHALDQLLHTLAHRPHQPERTLDRAYTAARSARQGTRLLPWIEKHLATFPDHALDLPTLAHQTDLPVDYLRWLSRYAGICDDEQPPARTFDAYLRLAAAGESAALHRLCALAPSARREKDCEQALNAALNRPQLQATAILLAQTDAIARRVLSAQLHQQPKARDLHYAASLASAAAKGSGSAALVWQDFLRRFPADLPAQRRLIQAHLSAGQPALALRVYAALPSYVLTEEDLRERTILGQL